MIRVLNILFFKYSLLIIFGLVHLVAAGANKNDSLIKAIKSGKEDTLKVKALYFLAYALKNNDPDTGIILSGQAMKLAEKLKWERGVATALRSLGACNRLKGNFNEALEYYFSALEKFTSIHDKTNISITLGNIGVVYKNQANYPKALEYEFKALHMADDLQDKPESARHKANIGLVFLNQGDLDKAIEYTEKALVQYRELKDMDGVANCVGGLGNIYGTKGSRSIEKGDDRAAAENYFPKTLRCYEEALKLVTEMNEKRDIALYYDNIAVVYKEEAVIAENQKEKERLFELSLEYHFKALAINEKIANPLSVAENRSNIGATYKAMATGLTGPAKTAKLHQAEKFLTEAALIYRNIGALNYIAITEGLLSEVYSQLDMHQAAYDHYLDHVRFKDSLFNEETKKKTLRAEMNFEFEKKQALARAAEDKKDAVLKAAEDRERQRNQLVLFTILGGLCTMLVFSSFVFRAFRQKQKDNVVITEQKELVERQKGLVEEKQKEVLDSIHYAKRIQTALLSNEKYIQRQLQKLKN